MLTAMEDQATPVPKAQVIIIGTSHIAQDSADAIARAFSKTDPDIIAVELDKRRLRSLQEQAAGAKDHKLPLSMIKQVGVTGYLFLLIGKTVQKRLGSIVKVDPGVDMLAAVRTAHANKRRLALIDQDIMVTMRRLSAEFTFKEKMKMLMDVISSPFNKRMRKVKIKLDKVPDAKTIAMLMSLLKERYPSLYNVLIIERNIFMARNIDHLVRHNPGKRILVVVGAGHEEDLRERLRHLERVADVTKYSS